MSAAVAIRDTDADWRRLGDVEPYWGVLTQPQFRAERLTPESLETFYATGREDMAGVVEKLTAVTGAAPGGRALDFGCGAGRLTEAMAAYAREVVGYDISSGMLERARARGGRATYVDALPPGPFDWINSFIVFQHIPPERGLPLMEDLLARLAPGGHLSLQVTIWREHELEPPPRPDWRRALSDAFGRGQPVGTIQMYDYDLSSVVRLLNRAGVGDLTLVSTDHGGHHGVIVLARKPA